MYVAEESLLDASVFYSKRYGKINRIGLIIIALVCPPIGVSHPGVARQIRGS